MGEFVFGRSHHQHLPRSPTRVKEWLRTSGNGLSCNGLSRVLRGKRVSKGLVVHYDIMTRLQQRLRALRQRPCHASRDRSQGRADSADCAAAARGSCSSSFCGAPATANMRSGGTNCAWRSIGSLSGSHWLVRRAATDLHCFAVGIEASDCIDAGELSPALRSSGAHGDHQVIRGPEGPSCLAEIRCRICMSVVHHIIRAYGLATARIRNRARVSREQRADLRGRYGRRKLVDRVLA